MCVKLDAKYFAKATAKPHRREFASSSRRTILIGERIWTGVEPRKCPISNYVSKKLILLPRSARPPRTGQAHVQFFLLRLHCAEVNSEAKDMANCRSTLLPLRKQLKLFFASLFLRISSVFTDQLRTCVKKKNPIEVDRSDLIW